MGGKKYTTEVKVEAAKQVLDYGRPVREVASRLGVSIDSPYAWVREQRKEPAVLGPLPHAPQAGEHGLDDEQVFIRC